MFKAEYSYDFENVKYDGEACASLHITLTFFNNWFDKFERGKTGALEVELSDFVKNEFFASEKLEAEVATIVELSKIFKLGYLETEDEAFIFQFNFIKPSKLFDPAITKMVEKLGRLEAKID